MSVIRKSSRFESTSANLPHNNPTVADFSGKVQTSSLIEATISEIRPGGDVILATPQGLVRTNATIPLEEGDKVLVRITNDDDDSDLKAHIISRSGDSNTLNRIEKFGIDLLNKYISQNTNDDNNAHNGAPLSARVTYVTANRNTLKYGSIKPGDEITIQMLSPKTPTNGINVIVGEVLGNSHNSIILNSSLGMLNISAKSNLSMGDKVLFKVVGTPDDFEQDLIKTSIQKVINDISGNKEHMNMLLESRLNIENNDNYTRFLQLISSAGTHNITLARLFHNAKNVLPNDVERWIDQDIIEPFEASTKSSIFGMLSEDITKISKLFVELKIIPDHNVWQIFEMPIPGTNENAKMRIRTEKENLIEFMIEFTHDTFGRMLIQGKLMLAASKGGLHNLNITIRHSGSMPSKLQDLIYSSFAAHKSLSSMCGEIVFEKMDEA